MFVGCVDECWGLGGIECVIVYGFVDFGSIGIYVGGYY